MIYDRFGGQLDSAQLIAEPQQVETAALRASSCYLLNQLGSPLIPGVTAGQEQAWAPGMVQPFASTAATLLQALGSPGGIVAANVLAIYLCDSATPLVDSLGLGPNLTAVGAPLTGRECVGLPTTSFNAKVGCELAGGATRFSAAAAGSFDANNNVKCFLIVCRDPVAPVANGYVFGKETSAPDHGFGLSIDAGGAGTGYYFMNQTDGWANLGAGTAYGGWNVFSCVADDTVRRLKLHSNLGTSTSGVLANSFTNGALFTIGRPDAVWLSGTSQIAYLAVLDVEVTLAMVQTFWRAFQAAALGTPCTYTRAEPYVVPISASRVAAYGASQVAIGYEAGFAADGNALKTGLVCEDAVTFEPIGSNDCVANAANAGANTTARVDGADGMQSGVRATQGGAWSVAQFSRLGAAPIAGASNVPWYGGAYYRRATVGNTGQLGMYFSGDAGGAEFITIMTDAATPVDWARGGGTCTPTRAGHTNAYLLFGATNNADNCDFSELVLVKGRTTAPLAWRRVGIAAAAATATPALSMTNTSNRRYSPVRGCAQVKVSGLMKKEEQYIANYATAAAGYGDCVDGLGNIWCTNYTTANITKLDRNGGLVGAYGVGANPVACCYDPTTNTVWVTNQGGNTVTKLNAATGATIGTYATGVQPAGVCTDGTNIWCANWSGGAAATVTKLLAATGGFIGAYNVQNGANGCAYDQATASIWVTNYNSNSVTKLVAATGAFVANYATGANPDYCCTDGTNIWITNYGAGTVTKLLAATGAFVSTTTVGANPEGICFDGVAVWVTNQGPDTLMKIRQADGVVIASYVTGLNPSGVAFDGAYVWVRNANAATVWRFGARQVLLACGAEEAAGALAVDYAGGVSFVPLVGTAPQLRLRAWDSAAALVATVNCGALGAGEYTLDVLWDARYPVALGATTGKYLAVKSGVTVLGSGGAPWTPPTADVSPLYVGADAAGANAARCVVELAEWFNR